MRLPNTALTCEGRFNMSRAAQTRQAARHLAPFVRFNASLARPFEDGAAAEAWTSDEAAGLQQ